MTSNGVQATTIPSRNACRDVIVLSSVNPLSSGSPRSIRLAAAGDSLNVFVA
jgi:hypothetical protein